MKINRLTSTAIITVISCFISLSVAFGADKFKNVPLEDGYETNSDKIILPTTVGGSLVFKDCPQCRHSSLTATADSTFFINANRVSMSDLNMFVRKGGPYFVMVFQKADSATLSRVVVYNNAVTTSKK